MSATIWLLVGAGAWFFYAVIAGVRDRIASRVATWLLPDIQPCTFRLACLMAAVSRRLAPGRRLSVFMGPPGVPEMVAHELDWTSPEAAIAELDAYLRDEQPAVKPVRLVAPLMTYAVMLRLRNLGEMLRYGGLVGLLVAVPVIASVLLVPMALVEWLLRKIMSLPLRPGGREFKLVTGLQGLAEKPRPARERSDVRRPSRAMAIAVWMTLMIVGPPALAIVAMDRILRGLLALPFWGHGYRFGLSISERGGGGLGPLGPLKTGLRYLGNWWRLEVAGRLGDD